MKYVVILLIVVVLVRIDVVVSLFEKVSSKLTRTKEDTSFQAPQKANTLVSFKDDQNLKQSPRKILFSILTEFISDPSLENHNRAMDMMKANPQFFSAQQDQELESVIFRFRDLLLSRNIQTMLFLNDLQTVLTGENLVMIRKVTSLGLDSDAEFFFKNYISSKDKLCEIANLIAYNLPLQERQNTLFDRESKINIFLSKEGRDPSQKLLATRCQALIRQELDKLTPQNQPITEPTPAEENL